MALTLKALIRADHDNHGRYSSVVTRTRGKRSLPARKGTVSCLCCRTSDISEVFAAARPSSWRCPPTAALVLSQNYPRSEQSTATTGLVNTAAFIMHTGGRGKNKASNYNTTILQWTIAKYLHFHLKTSCLASGGAKLPHPFVNVPQFLQFKSNYFRCE